MAEFTSFTNDTLPVRPVAPAQNMATPVIENV